MALGMVFWAGVLFLLVSATLLRLGFRLRQGYGGPPSLA
jgi:hypothetical protein